MARKHIMHNPAPISDDAAQASLSKAKAIFAAMSPSEQARVLKQVAIVAKHAKAACTNSK
jgi:hypothetical protein